VFRRLTVAGQATASLVFGYHTAAVLASWSVSKSEAGVWSLDAIARELDPVKCRPGDRDFYLVIPRKGGYLLFPVRAMVHDGTAIAATLGPLEH